MNTFHVYLKGQKDFALVKAETVAEKDGMLIFTVAEDTVARFPKSEVQGWNKIFSGKPQNRPTSR